LLKAGSSGVIFQTSDQVAMAILAWSSPVRCCCSPPTLRVGSAGLSVRNLLGYRLIPWSEVSVCRFPR